TLAALAFTTTLGSARSGTFRREGVVARPGPRSPLPWWLWEELLPPPANHKSGFGDRTPILVNGNLEIPQHLFRRQHSVFVSVHLLKLGALFYALPPFVHADLPVFIGVQLFEPRGEFLGELAGAEDGGPLVVVFFHNRFERVLPDAGGVGAPLIVTLG